MNKISGLPKCYSGLNSFSSFLCSKITITKNEEDQILRKDFGIAYKNFCNQSQLEQASVIDYVGHLIQLGVTSKIVEKDDNIYYMFCGVVFKNTERNNINKEKICIPSIEEFPVFPKCYSGISSFLSFLRSKVSITKKEEDQILRKDFGIAYKNFCIQSNFNQASIIDFVGHLTQLGITKKIIEKDNKICYMFCGVAWKNTERDHEDNLKVHGMKSNSAVHSLSTNVPELREHATFLTFCESNLVFTLKSEHCVTLEELNISYMKFSQKKISIAYIKTCLLNFNVKCLELQHGDGRKCCVFLGVNLLKYAVNHNEIEASVPLKTNDSVLIVCTGEAQKQEIPFTFPFKPKRWVTGVRLEKSLKHLENCHTSTKVKEQLGIQKNSNDSVASDVEINSLSSKYPISKGDCKILKGDDYCSEKVQASALLDVNKVSREEGSLLKGSQKERISSDVENFSEKNNQSHVSKSASQFKRDRSFRSQHVLCKDPNITKSRLVDKSCSSMKSPANSKPNSRKNIANAKHSINMGAIYNKSKRRAIKLIENFFNSSDTGNSVDKNNQLHVNKSASQFKRERSLHNKRGRSVHSKQALCKDQNTLKIKLVDKFCSDSKSVTTVKHSSRKSLLEAKDSTSQSSSYDYSKRSVELDSGSPLALRPITANGVMLNSKNVKPCRWVAGVRLENINHCDALISTSKCNSSLLCESGNKLKDVCPSVKKYKVGDKHYSINIDDKRVEKGPGHFNSASERRKGKVKMIQKDKCIRVNKSGHSNGKGHDEYNYGNSFRESSVHSCLPVNEYQIDQNVSDVKNSNVSNSSSMVGGNMRKISKVFSPDISNCSELKEFFGGTDKIKIEPVEEYPTNGFEEHEAQRCIEDDAICMMNYLKENGKPKRYVSRVLLRDIKRYPLYQSKLNFYKDEFGCWILINPPGKHIYKGLDSFKNFVKKHICFTGKPHNLILSNDLCAIYRKFCYEHSLEMASQKDIEHHLSVIGIRSHYKFVDFSSPKLAFSGLNWKDKALSNKFGNNSFNVIIHDYSA